MNATPQAGSPIKYRWREVDRVTPPKRPALKRLADFSETESPYDEETAAAQASRCVQCPNPSCVEACPLGVPLPDVLALVADRKFKEAAERLVSTHSLPEVFAQVCAGQHLCEAACVLAAKSEPLAIGALAKFLLAYGREHRIPEPPPAPATGTQVAVIGAGLCGLVAADALSRNGYGVMVLDCHEQPGGRMMNGLPGFKVDPQAIAHRVQALRERGVGFRMGVVCGRDVTLERLRKEFDAVFIGLGRAEAVPLNIPGAGLHGVFQAYPFILASSSRAPVQSTPVEVQGRRVLILGGGETAMDAARVALRRHAKEVLCLYRRDPPSMPCLPESYADAREEGARFLFQVQPVAVLGDSQDAVRGVRCSRTEMDRLAASGWARVQAIANSEFDVPGEVVLVAYGFAPPKLPEVGDFAVLARDDRGCLKVDQDQMTNLPGVFAGGSVVRGQADLAEVVRDARNAAAAVERYLAVSRLKSGIAEVAPVSGR
jgi:glutamate synthase (NADPH/NADH) small chain